MAAKNSEKSKNALARVQTAVNHWQQRHKLPAFSYAIVKKYGEDEASLEGALITYYGFLSLFPLLLVATSILEIVTRSNEHIRDKFISSINAYLPIVGDQLQANLHSPHRSGIALLVGLLITLYGARGGASALSHALNHIWQVPRRERSGFPGAVAKNLAVIIIGGGGLLLANVLSSYAAAIGSGAGGRLLSILVASAILFADLLLVFRLSIDGKVGFKDIWVSALVSAIGLQILQLAGVYFLKHQLANLKNLYGTFAIVLGLMAWIYLQVQLLLYAVELDTVRQLKLWPRSMDSGELTDQDRHAYRLYAHKERLVSEEEINVKV